MTADVALAPLTNPVMDEGVMLDKFVCWGTLAVKFIVPMEMVALVASVPSTMLLSDAFVIPERLVCCGTLAV